MAFVSLIGVLLLAVFFIIIVLSYRYLYKQNMNKALEGEATEGLIDIGALVKAITFVALIVLNIVSLIKISNLEFQISNLQSNITTQMNTLSSRVNSISSEYLSFIQSQELIQQKDYELESYGVDQFNYTVSFTLLEIETGADVYLVVDKDNESTRYLLSSTSLSFSTNIALDNDAEYSLSVLIEGTTTIQEELFDIDVEQDAGEVIDAYMLPDINFNNDTEFIRIEVVNKLPDEEIFSIASVKFEVYDDEVLFLTQILTEETDMELLLEPYRLEGDIENGDEFEIYPEGSFYAIITDEIISWNRLSAIVTVTLDSGDVIIFNVSL